MHFLVIDDDELSRELLSILLEAEGHDVQVACSGEEALAWLRAKASPTPDVVLSDMQMPGISGKALAAELRGAAGGKVQLLAMSGSQPAAEALTGFDAFLLKPFSMADLDAVLSRTENSFDSDPAALGDGETGPMVPALNEEIYAKMARMMPADQLNELYAMCLEDARKRLAQMDRLAESGDDESFRRAAHTVKGGCGMIGATELYSLAEIAERHGLGHDTAPDSAWAAGTSGVTTLLQRFSRACDQLERILGERKQENFVPHLENECR